MDKELTTHSLLTAMATSFHPPGKRRPELSSCFRREAINAMKGVQFNPRPLDMLATESQFLRVVVGVVL